MINVAEKIRDLRQSLGLSQQKMADMIGIPQTTWAAWESGRSDPTLKAIMVLAEKGYIIKGVTPDPMEDWPEKQKKEFQRRMDIVKTGAFPPDMPVDDVARIVKAVDDHPKTPIYNRSDLEGKKNAFVIPLLSQKLSADGGQELPQEDEVTALIPVPAHLAKYGKSLAALTVEGDSMYPTLDRGDVVVCDSCGWSGEGIYALRMSGDGFVKRLTKAPGKLVIISDNPKYPIREEPEDSQDFEIIGRVHCAIKNLE